MEKWLANLHKDIDEIVYGDHKVPTVYSLSFNLRPENN